MNQNNPHLKRLDQLNEAHKQYLESEWTLQFLRSIEPNNPKLPTNQEILLWYQAYSN